MHASSQRGQKGGLTFRISAFWHGSWLVFGIARKILEGASGVCVCAHAQVFSEYNLEPSQMELALRQAEGTEAKRQ